MVKCKEEELQIRKETRNINKIKQNEFSTIQCHLQSSTVDTQAPQIHEEK